MGNDMPIGLCCVCDKGLGQYPAGPCRTCGGKFCWDTCCGWAGDQHQCASCTLLSLEKTKAEAPSNG